MAKKAFAGTPSKRLPKGKREPYRLWFEYLKLALRVPEMEVDSSLYAPWGDIEDRDFDEWWEEKWTELFALDAPTKILTATAEAEEALRDLTTVVLRVSLTESKKRRMKDIEDALAGVEPVKGTKGRRASLFELSSKRSINYKTLRGMLRYYQLYEENGRDIEEASIAYLTWSRAWNERVRAKKWKRPFVYEPTFLSRFVKEIADKQAGNEKRSKNTREYDELRSEARRFLRKGEKVLTNAAMGKFPGTF